ncbi:MAG: RNA polymerase sigma factor [Planctomycetota bacterium]|jgi:RNA polymerase sigma-70 factor (ECF subfamily)
MEQDRERIERCLAGEPEAFHGLVEDYQGAVYRVVRRFLVNPDDALEITQETFARAFEKLGTFDRSRPFRAWLLSVAANLCRDLLRKSGRRSVVLDHERLDGVPAGAPPESVASEREEAERLRRAVDRLTDDKRLAVVLRYFEGMSIAEISEITGTDASTLKVRLFRARKDLGRMLEAS